MSINNEKTISNNGRNAYVSITSFETNTKLSDSLYLTAKPLTRTRSLSPSLFNNNNQPVTTVDGSAIKNPKLLLAPGSVAAAAKPFLLNTEKKSETVEMQKPKVQVGIDRYITVLKRGRSPNSSKVASVPKVLKDGTNSQNRFAILEDESSDAPIVVKSTKPPPIYLREQNSNELIKNLISIIGENSFYVSAIKRGSINETKIQVNSESDYRKIVSNLEALKKGFYTYQLKSSKGLQVVVKGIDSCVDPDEIKSFLEDKGFKIKNVANIKNREKIPQPLFRVELEPGDVKLKKNETHPIYNLKYVLHRRITIEEPHKRNGPVQCLNCQEFGHTRAYCHLAPVCVVCGELHGTVLCDKSKNDPNVKKCSNCGGNHTANYRGCPVYSIVKRSVGQKPNPHQTHSTNHTNTNYIPAPQPSNNSPSYANIVKANHMPVQDPLPNNGSNPVLSPEGRDETPVSNLSQLEKTMETLVQTINNFTNTMGNMMQEIIRMQSMLLQAIINKP